MIRLFFETPLEGRTALPNRIEPADQQHETASRALNHAGGDSRANILASTTRPVQDPQLNHVRIDEFPVHEVKSVDGGESYKGSIKFVVQREGEVFENPDPVHLKTIVKNAVRFNDLSSTTSTITKFIKFADRPTFRRCRKKTTRKMSDFSRQTRMSSFPSSQVSIRFSIRKLKNLRIRESQWQLLQWKETKSKRARTSLIYRVSQTTSTRVKEKTANRLSV